MEPKLGGLWAIQLSPATLCLQLHPLNILGTFSLDRQIKLSPVTLCLQLHPLNILGTCIIAQIDRQIQLSPATLCLQLHPLCVLTTAPEKMACFKPYQPFLHSKKEIQVVCILTSSYYYYYLWVLQSKVKVKAKNSLNPSLDLNLENRLA